MQFILPIFIFLTQFLFVFSTRCPPPPPPPCKCKPTLKFLDQRLAIVYPIIQTFKSLITSDPFNITNSWVGPDICNYKGFFCDTPPDNSSAIALAAIDFNGFHLSAPSLDGFIDEFPDLAIFHANSNNFSGTISPKLSNLPYLYELDLSNNLLSGAFPTAILNTKQLLFLDIRFNFFSGLIPPQIFTKDLELLDFLFINNNNFIQRLPDDFGSTKAAYLTLANNRFTGPIPRSIGNASSTLIEILLLNNQLSGCVPYEVGFLKEATVFDAGDNLLRGPLPCSLGCLEKIEQLNFAGNFLHGQVPEVACELGNLLNFSLSDNYFTKIGQSCKKLVQNGVLDLRMNCIAGLADQRSPLECALFSLFERRCPFPASYEFVPCEKSPSIHSRKNNYAAIMGPIP